MPTKRVKLHTLNTYSLLYVSCTSIKLLKFYEDEASVCYEKGRTKEAVEKVRAQKVAWFLSQLGQVWESETAERKLESGIRRCALTPSHSPLLDSPSVLSHRLWEMSGVLCLCLVCKAGLVPFPQLWNSVPPIFLSACSGFRDPCQGVHFWKSARNHYFPQIFWKYFTLVCLDIWFLT